MDFSVQLPINSLSFGQVSVSLLWEMYQRELQPCVFPIGDERQNLLERAVIGSYDYVTPDFTSWLTSNIKKSLRHHSRSNPSFRLWHLRPETLESLSHKIVLMTFHETNRLTDAERNIVNNQSSVLVTSSYTFNVFKEAGCQNVVKVPLGFDKNSFKIIHKNYHAPNIIVFGVVGKLEYRKRHVEILKYWSAKYGNDRNYALNCAIFNPFIPPQQQEHIVASAVAGKKYWNINFNSFMEKNAAYNDFLNSNDAVIGLSGAEGFGLPEFQSVALGKHGLILNATGYTEWANETNSVLVEPNGMKPMYDGMFFPEGIEFNQGDGYTWDKESFYKGMDRLIERVRKTKINEEGLKLQDQFTYSKTLDVILEELWK